MTPEPKTCKLCGNKAMYHVGAVGFCFGHKREAVEATARENSRIRSQMGVDSYLGERNHGKRRTGDTGSGVWQGYDMRRGE